MKNAWNPTRFLILVLASIGASILFVSWFFFGFGRAESSQTTISAPAREFSDKVWIHGLGVDIRTDPFVLAELEKVVDAWPAKTDEVSVFRKGVAGPVIRFHPSEFSILAYKDQQVLSGSEILISRKISSLESLVLLVAVVLVVLAWLVFIFAGIRSCSAGSAGLSSCRLSLVSFALYMIALCSLALVASEWLDL